MRRGKDIVEIDIDDSEYPERLRRIENPPKRLFCKGDITLMNSISLGVVGSRKASEYGKQVAMKIGKRAAENHVVVVGGMAKGIDSFGHWGALKSGGKTIAILGCGIDVCYPTENVKLYRQIAEQGLLVSEFEMGKQPRPFMFPVRNRIISALSDSLVVVEAGTNSGSLITAELGVEQGKEIFAVPGNINAQFSLGTNKLIADGARIVTVIDDIFFTMGVELNREYVEKTSLGREEKLIYNMVKKEGEISIDFLCNRLHKTTVEVNGIVTILEMKGLISYNFGKVFLAKM